MALMEFTRSRIHTCFVMYQIITRGTEHISIFNFFFFYRRLIVLVENDMMSFVYTVVQCRLNRVQHV